MYDSNLYNDPLNRNHLLMFAPSISGNAVTTLTVISVVPSYHLFVDVLCVIVPAVGVVLSLYILLLYLNCTDPVCDIFCVNLYSNLDDMSVDGNAVQTTIPDSFVISTYSVPFHHHNAS